jgi:putative conjugative transfer gene complex protein
MEAAVDYATSQPGGRLSTPALVMLDEAANVCRWAELPNMYSHFGSRGICVDTVLQSWSQGVVAWGPEGMNKLWSASNVKLYGGSVDEDEFLQRLSSLIGSHWIDSKQFSHSETGSSSSVTPDSQERRIATVSDLRSMPMHRAWTLASGAPAVLTRLVPFWETTNPTDNEEAAAA